MADWEYASLPARSQQRLTGAQHEWANAVADVVGEAELREALATVQRVIKASRRYRSQRRGGGADSA